MLQEYISSFIVYCKHYQFSSKSIQAFTLLNVTGRCFAPISYGVTPLQHPNLHRKTGCMLHDLMAVTITVLTPASRS